MNGETQPNEVVQEIRSREQALTNEKIAIANKIVSGEDARGSIVWNATREAITDPNRNTHGVFPIISRQYQELGALIPDLAQPGKTNEAITLIESITEAGGMPGMSVYVDLPENATEGEKHRALQEKVRQLHEELPVKIADYQLQRYIDVRAEQSLYEHQLEDLTMKPGQETSRAAARKAMFDYERTRAKVAEAEDEILENTGQWDDRVLELRVAQQVPSHFEREAVLQAVDARKQAERAAIQERAVQKIAVKSDELMVVFNRYNIPNDVTGSQAHILLTELPEYVNESLTRGYGRNIDLVEARFGTFKAELQGAIIPLAQGIEQAGEKVDEKIAQAQNIVKNVWQRAVVENIANVRANAREVHNRWKAKKEEAFTEKERNEIITKRNHFNRVHEKEVNRLMKLEEQLVRQWARNNGRSIDEVESRLRQRREEIAEKKRPNPAQEVFLTILDEHVRPLAQAPMAEQRPQVPDLGVTRPHDAVTSATGEESTAETPRVDTVSNAEVTQVLDVRNIRNRLKWAEETAARQVPPVEQDPLTMDLEYLPETDETAAGPTTVNERLQVDAGEADTRRNEAISQQSPQERFEQADKDRIALMNAFTNWRNAGDADRAAARAALDEILARARENAQPVPEGENTENIPEDILKIREFLRGQRVLTYLISRHLEEPEQETEENFKKNYDRLYSQQYKLRNAIFELTNPNRNAAV